MQINIALKCLAHKGVPASLILERFQLGRGGGGGGRVVRVGLVGGIRLRNFLFANLNLQS